MTPSADAILEDRDVLVLPDVLANAGGVVVSYFEWVQGLQEYFWREDEVNAKLHDIVARAFEEAWQTRDRYDDEPAHVVLRARGAARHRGDDDAGPVPVAPKVTLYHAPDCRLCERALEVVQRRAGRARVRARARRHRRRPELERRYREHLPVVEIDGERAFTYFVDADALRARFAV